MQAVKTVAKKDTVELSCCCLRIWPASSSRFFSHSWEGDILVDEVTLGSELQLRGIV